MIKNGQYYGRLYIKHEKNEIQYLVDVMDKKIVRLMSYDETISESDYPINVIFGEGTDDEHTLEIRRDEISISDKQFAAFRVTCKLTQEPDEEED